MSVGVLIWRSFRRQCKLKRRCQMRTKRLQGMLEMVFVIMLATIYVCCWGNSCHWDDGGREGWGEVLVHCCIPVSLLIGGWDWVQGGNPLYAAVKCLSDRRGQIWRIFFNFFAKSTCHIHFPGGIFFGGSKNFFYPLKWAILWGHLHFSKIEGPGCERTPFVYQFVCFRIDLTPSNN